MIEFLKPNKSKLKLGILIFFLIFLFYSAQSMIRPVLNNYSSQEFQELLKNDKYNELRQYYDSLKPIYFKGDEISSTYTKYILIDGIISFFVSVILSYLGSCLIFRLWKLKPSQ